MASPLVSVVIPAFNAGQWIDETIDSVLAQTYPAASIEVVVVDDGSSDDTAERAMRRLAGSRALHRVLTNVRTCGPGAARNRGWRTSSGDWIQFLDADDLLASTKLDCQVRTISDAPSSSAVVFSPWARLRHVEGQWISAERPTHPVVGSDPILAVLRTENFMQLGSLLFSRHWLTEVAGFNEDYRFIEDVDLILRILMRGGTLCPAPAEEPLAWYRQLDRSLSRSDNGAFVEGCIRNADLVASFWRSRSLLTTDRTRGLADVYYMAARFYADKNEDAFGHMVGKIAALGPGLLPPGPASLRLLSRLLGYPSAERVATRYRHLRQLVR